MHHDAPSRRAADAAIIRKKGDCSVRRILASAFLIAGFAASALAQEAKQTSRSSTERASEVYVSPGKADDWQNDVLGKDSLDDGRTANIKFNRASKTCIWT
jgi:hypothetical protein